ncbi:3-oxoacyl-ACP reductase FabG [soil metagenome]
MTKLHGRVALITGGSRGIGRATSIALAQAGCDVIVNYLKDQESADAVVQAVEKLGRRGRAIRADVSSEGDVTRLVAESEAALGKIDVLINNAGINPSKPLAELTLADWKAVLDLNLTSAFLVSQAVLPGMRKRQWGRLVMMSSVAAQTGGVIGPHYAASKAGMIGLAHSYAQLLAKEGITANAIAPALIDTDMIRGNSKIQPSLLPVNRFGTADEVAQAVVFLAQNGYVTGQTISINGGWYMT